MFGYIKPLEAQLRVCELEAYKAVYCGICRALSKKFGPFARLTLSYDFTFVSMLYSSLSDQPPQLSLQRCPFNPFSKRPHADRCDAIDFSCDVAILQIGRAHV